MIENKNITVFIPTAGVGSRLKNLTKFINKSLVRVNKKPAISYIIESFPQNAQFIIALGYKGDLVQKYLTNTYPNKNIKFVWIEKFEGEGSGLGLTLLNCKNLLQKPFIFCSCDTIVKEKIKFSEQNTIVYDRKENKIQYRTIEIKNNKVICLLEKGQETKTSLPYIGLANIHDWKKFWEIMQEGKEQAIKDGESYVLRHFAKEGKLFAKQYTWFDTGNIEELEKTRKYFKRREEQVFKAENKPNIRNYYQQLI